LDFSREIPIENIFCTFFETKLGQLGGKQKKNKKWAGCIEPSWFENKRFFLEKIGIGIGLSERIFCMEEIQKDILIGDFSIIQKSNIYLMFTLIN
jgi:hypothetical protein